MAGLTRFARSARLLQMTLYLPAHPESERNNGPTPTRRGVAFVPSGQHLDALTRRLMNLHRVLVHAAVLLALTGPALAHAEGSMQVGTYNLAESWSRVQGRLMLGVGTLAAGPDAEANGNRLTSVSLLGDYYMSGPRSARAGGLRATSGLMAGPRSSMWGSLSSGSGLHVERRPGVSSFLLGDTDSAQQTVPYLGIGYTGLSLRDGWGVSVDVGLMALRPRQAGQIGSVLNGTQGFDSMLRDMRLSPILQLGISYSF